MGKEFFSLNLLHCLIKQYYNVVEKIHSKMDCKKKIATYKLHIQLKLFNFQKKIAYPLSSTHNLLATNINVLMALALLAPRYHASSMIITIEL